MAPQTPAFTLPVDGVAGTCPAGERYAIEQVAHGRIPVLSCEGACTRGEIARVAANMVAAEDQRCARACHAETFFVPHSAMSQWVRGADRVLVIDGCFLQCHGRVLRNLVPADRVIHVDAHRIHRKFADAFSPEEVPERERNVAARRVADAAHELVNADQVP
jgi:uncharacterized metal-binding protein